MRVVRSLASRNRCRDLASEAGGVSVDLNDLRAMLAEPERSEDESAINPHIAAWLKILRHIDQITERRRRA